MNRKTAKPGSRPAPEPVSALEQALTPPSPPLDPALHLAAIIDSAGDAIISKDLSGIVTSWNPAACAMFGYSADEMIGHSILQLIPGELYGEEDEILRKLRAGERIEHYETTRRGKNGETFEVSVTISPVRDSNGRIIGASKIARDISDRRRMERLLVQSEKLAATGRMAAAIAHEINNPLDALMNLIFLARKSGKNLAADKYDEYLDLAEQELRRIAHIARQTLGFYRETTSPVEVYIHTLIENILAVYRPKMGPAISVVTRFNDLQKILVNKGEMIQIFSNIIANAIDAMHGDGGTLRISTRRVSAGDGVEISISDTGTGIKRESLQEIFEPFFTTKGNLGTGIGLWVARQLAEARGGRISIASSTEPGNSGTTVTVYIPYAAPPITNSMLGKSTTLLPADTRLTLVLDRKTGTTC